MTNANRSLSLIERQNGKWKIFLGRFSLLLACLSGLFSNIIYKNQSYIGEDITTILMFSSILTFPLFIYLELFAIKCKNCKNRIPIYYAKNNSPFTYFSNILKINKCPICGEE